MITYKSGNLFKDDTLDALAHGCNCAGAMGKGIALTFKNKYPKMYLSYKSSCSNKTFTLGDVFVWKDDKIIFNLGTQTSWKTPATLTAIEKSLTRMKYLAEEMNIKRIGIPRIGAGLGGLNWNDVKAIIEKVFSISNIDLIVYEYYVE